MTDAEMLYMLVDYMGRGFLENIVALMKQEPELARFIPAMIAQENLGVRLGTTALVEELSADRRDVLRHAVPGLIELLRHENPTVRGDAASLLGTIGDETARGPLATLLEDGHEAVRMMASSALEDIARKG